MRELCLRKGLTALVGDVVVALMLSLLPRLRRQRLWHHWAEQREEQPRTVMLLPTQLSKYYVTTTPACWGCWGWRDSWLSCLLTGNHLNKKATTEINFGERLFLALPLLTVYGSDDIPEGDIIELFLSLLTNNVLKLKMWIGRGLPFFLKKE